MQSKVEVLSEIIQSIQSLNVTGENILMQGGRDILNLSQISQTKNYQDGIGPTTEFGIDSLLFNTYHLDLAIPDPLSVLFVQKDVLHTDRTIKSDFQVKDIRAILERCKVISFANWASFQGASDVWDRLRTNVIRPIGRNDFEFIFYMGDTAKKLNFEIDEILDIISDFSTNGKVTLVLTDKEVFELWKTLNGEQDNKERSFNGITDFECQYIFNTISIHQLLVYCPDHRVKIFSKERSLEMSGRNLNLTNGAYQAQNYFDAGYILGLLLQLSTVHCTAIGLEVAGAYLRNEVIPDLKTLVRHINDWINELDRYSVGSATV